MTSERLLRWSSFLCVTRRGVPGPPPSVANSTHGLVRRPSEGHFDARGLAARLCLMTTTSNCTTLPRLLMRRRVRSRQEESLIIWSELASSELLLFGRRTLPRLESPVDRCLQKERGDSIRFEHKPSHTDCEPEVPARCAFVVLLLRQGKKTRTTFHLNQFLSRVFGKCKKKHCIKNSI